MDPWAKLSSLIVTVSCLAPLGCTIVEKNETSIDFSAISGVFEISQFNRNDDGCDNAENSVLGSQSDKFLLSQGGTVLDVSFLTVYTCENLEDCREKSRALNNGLAVSSVYRYTVDQVGVQGFEGLRVSEEGQRQSGLCQGFEVKNVTISATSERVLNVRAETYSIVDFAPDSSLGCDGNIAKSYLPKSQCTGLEILAADFVSEI